jgi:hypothetical protein
MSAAITSALAFRDVTLGYDRAPQRGTRQCRNDEPDTDRQPHERRRQRSRRMRRGLAMGVVGVAVVVMAMRMIVAVMVIVRVGMVMGRHNLDVMI